MDDTRRDLRSYYEAEAQLRLRESVKGQRVGLTEEFIALLRSEGRRSVIDFGSGPGHDGERFAGGGIQYVGIDLAMGNARLAAEREVTVLHADVATPPFRQHAFDAGWSMSVLMHLREIEVPEVIRRLSEVLCPGAPLLVGLWGGDQGDVVSEQGVAGERRLFSLRSYETNARLLATGGRIEWSTTWRFGEHEWEYHVFRLRSGQA